MARSDSPRRSVRLTTSVVLLLTFMAGGATGAAVHAWLRPTRLRHAPPPFFPVPMEELNLSSEQQEKSRAILERYRPRLESIVRETFPRVREVNALVEKEIWDLLTPEQRERANELRLKRPHRLPPPPFLMNGSAPAPSNFPPPPFGFLPPPPPDPSE